MGEAFVGSSLVDALVVVVLLVVIPLLWAIAAYNGMVGLRVRIDNAWSDIDVQLKRRHDLVPNLVETVKGYTAHERETLEAVIQARNAAATAAGNANPAQRGEAENVLTGALRQLFALAESYPELKANENFLQLQGELSQIEDDIQNARRYYNAVVRDYNTAIQTFPRSLIASNFGFSPRDFFQVGEEEREVPKVKF